jgi:hypothetical protein
MACDYAEQPAPDRPATSTNTDPRQRTRHNSALGIILQAFNGCVALTGLLLAALMHQRDRARRDVEQACARLSELVTHLDTALRARRELDTRRVESVRADRSE